VDYDHFTMYVLVIDESNSSGDSSTSSSPSLLLPAVLFEAVVEAGNALGAFDFDLDRWPFSIEAIGLQRRGKKVSVSMASNRLLMYDGVWPCASNAQGKSWWRCVLLQSTFREAL